MTDHYEQLSMYATGGPVHTCSCGEMFTAREDFIEHMFDLQGTAFTLSFTVGDGIGQSGIPIWGIKVKEGHTEMAVKDCIYCKRKLNQSAPDIQCRMSHWMAYHMRDIPTFNNRPIFSTTDGVIKCDDCGFYIHEIKPLDCKSYKHPPMLMTGLTSRSMVDPSLVNATPYTNQQDEAMELLSKVDTMLDEGEFFHGPNCVSLYKDDEVAYIECKCGLKPLMDLQLTHIEPLLAGDKNE